MKDPKIGICMIVKNEEKLLSRCLESVKGFDKVDVLEWGSGYSTKYFPELLQKNNTEYTWKAMEHNQQWYEKVKAFGTRGVELVLADKDSKEYLEPEGKFDVIYVDGRNRVKCLKHARKVLKPNGVILLHDAQRERYQEGLKGFHGRFIGAKSPVLWVGTVKDL